MVVCDGRIHLTSPFKRGGPFLLMHVLRIFNGLNDKEHKYDVL